MATRHIIHNTGYCPGDAKYEERVDGKTVEYDSWQTLEKTLLPYQWFFITECRNYGHKDCHGQMAYAYKHDEAFYYPSPRVGIEKYTTGYKS